MLQYPNIYIRGQKSAHPISKVLKWPKKWPIFVKTTLLHWVLKVGFVEKYGHSNDQSGLSEICVYFPLFVDFSLL